ncbi:MAG: GlsB/YeaQ/YmgE family stress response membrane protein [Rhodomicrobium sp.]
MDPTAIIIMLLVGAIAGWLAGIIYSGAGFGLVGNIIIGLLGAIIAGYLLPGVLPLSGIVGQIISAAIGAVILLFLVNLVRRGTV